VGRHGGHSARLFGRKRLSQPATFGEGFKTLRGSRSLPSAVLKRRTSVLKLSNQLTQLR
jgi:hypothetical protein